MSDKTILYLDASAFKESGCDRRLKHIIVDGLRESGSAAALMYGTAVHKFIAHLRTTTDYKEALKITVAFYAPYSLELEPKEWRTLEHLLITCAGYYNNVYVPDVFSAMSYRNDEGKDVFLVEQKFAFPVHEDDSLIVMLCGTVDEVGMYADTKTVCICDRKTSSSYFKVDETLSLYRKSTQLMFYKFVIEKKIPQFKNIPVFIDGIFLASNQKPKFARSEMFEIPREDMERFESMLYDCIARIVKNFHANSWPKNFLLCDSTRYNGDNVGACRHFPHCSISDPELSEYIRKTKYVTKPYNPLLFDEEKS